MKYNNNILRFLTSSLLFLFLFIACKGEDKSTNKNSSQTDTKSSQIESIPSQTDNDTIADFKKNKAVTDSLPETKENTSQKEMELQNKEDINNKENDTPETTPVIEIKPIIIEYPHRIENIKQLFSEVKLLEPTIDESILLEMNKELLILKPLIKYNKPDLSVNDNRLIELLNKYKGIINEHLNNNSFIMVKYWGDWGNEIAVNKSDIIDYLEKLSQGQYPEQQNDNNIRLVGNALKIIGIENAASEIINQYNNINDIRAEEEAIRQYHLILNNIFNYVKDVIGKGLTQETEIFFIINSLEALSNKYVYYDNNNFRISTSNQSYNSDKEKFKRIIMNDVYSEWSAPKNDNGYFFINDSKVLESVKNRISVDVLSKLRLLCINIDETNKMYKFRKIYNDSLLKEYERLKPIVEKYSEKLENEESPSDDFQKTIDAILRYDEVLNDINISLNSKLSYIFNQGNKERQIENLNRKVYEGIDKKRINKMIEVCMMINENNKIKLKVAKEVYEKKVIEERDKNPVFISFKKAYLKGYQMGKETRKKHLGTPVLDVYENRAQKTGRELAEKEGIEGDESNYFSVGYTHGILGVPPEMPEM